VFFFPNRDAGFEFVDDIAGRVERLAAMRGGDADPNGEISDGKPSATVHRVRRFEVKFLPRLAEDQRSFLFGERRIGFIF
jgi:hypothetical protein